MKATLPYACAGLAAWCSLGTIGFVAAGGDVTRVGLMAPWWWLPLLIALFLAVARVAHLSAGQASPLFASAVLLLPWLPVPLPPAAFLWTGPLTIVIWMLVIGSVVHARLRTASAGWLTDAARAPLLAAGVALLLYGASARWLAPILPDGDSPHYLILAQSLISDGDLQIENNHRRGDYLGYSLQAAQPDYLRRGVNGQIYSIHAPGLPAVIAPAMWLSGYPGVVAFLTLIAAATTGLVWWLAFRLTEDRAAAWFAWACFGLTVPFFFQSTEVFPDGVAATCLLIGTLPLWLAEAHTRGGGGEYRFGRRVWWIAGAALALMPWLQTRLASLAAVAALLLVSRIRRVGDLIALATPPVVSAMGWFGFFWAVYGTPNPMAPYGTFTQTSVSNMTHGLPGALFDQQFGLISNSPVYGVVLAGCLVAALRLRRWSLELLALAVPYTISVAMYQHWWGGASAPARLLTPLTPVVALGAARLWARGRAVSHAWYLVALGVSVCMTALLLVPDQGRLLINFRDGIALWAEWAQDVLALSRALPSLFVGTPGHAVFIASIWVAVAAVVWIAVRDHPESDRHTAMTWQGISAIALLPMLALTIVWWIDRVPPVTNARSETGLLRTLAASPGRSAFDFGRWRVMTGADLQSRLAVRSDDQRPRSSARHILSAQFVPPGSYGIVLDEKATGVAGEGSVTLRVGDTTLPFLTLPVSSSHEQAGGGKTLTLPVTARSLIIEADDAALRSVKSAQLEPLSIPDRSAIAPGSARRGARYPTADAFFLDDNAYPEPTGFWIAGGRLARIVLATTSSSRLTLFIRNAPVQNVVSIDVDGAHHELTMAPREERELTIEATKPANVSTLRITVRSGFRPSQEEEGSRDLRYLGVWIEPR
jgi:hypothetical protein